MKVAITGLGLVSSIGHDVITACASFRAGMVRPTELDKTVLSYEDLEDVPVSGYPIRGITDGFAGLGLYILLSKLVFKDLALYSGIDISDREFFADTGLYVCISRNREANFEFYDEFMEESLARMISDQNGIVFHKDHQKVFFEGNASVLHAVKSAQREIETGEIKRVIVLSLDSLVGASSLNYFESQNRLKTVVSPAGLMPGEAGSAVLLEACESAQQRSASIDAYIDQINIGLDHSIASEEFSADARNLSATVGETVLGQTKLPSIYCDLNGEEWRAKEFGILLSRLSVDRYIDATNVYSPCESFGDTGAASGAISICASVRSHCLNYASGKESLIISRSATGEVASALVFAASAVASG